MKQPLGIDEDVVEKCKQHLKLAMKNKYWKKGYRAAAKKVGRYENPYTLPAKYWEILKKRSYWDHGWEQKAFSKSKKQLAKIKEDNQVKKREHKHKHKHEHKSRRHSSH